MANIKNIKAISGCILLIIITSCNLQKKAEQRVLSNYESIKRVRAATESIWPCVNDTVINTKSDTVVTEKVTVDTVTHTVTVQGEPETIIKTVTKTNTVIKTVHDTVTAVVTDNRLIGILKDDKEQLNQQIANLKGQLETTQSGSAKKTWWIVALSVALVGGGIFAFKSKLFG